MKVQIIKVLFLFISLFGYTQNQSGKVVYEIKFPEIIIKDSTKLKTYKQIESVSNEAKKYAFSLTFNKDNSFYNIENKINLDNLKPVEKISYTLFSKYSYYYDNKKKETFKIDNSEKNISIKLENVINWNINNETKKIGEYTCYKATCVKEFYNNKGLRRKDIIAWFCPELPYQFGPLEFNGLPGLILELQDNKITFVAKTIELTTNEITIKNPIVKSITEEEYLKKLKQNAPF